MLKNIIGYCSSFPPTNSLQKKPPFLFIYCFKPSGPLFSLSLWFPCERVQILGSPARYIYEGGRFYELYLIVDFDSGVLNTGFGPHIKKFRDYFIFALAESLVKSLIK